MTFQGRLKAAMRGGNLTVADLARWFDVPYPTIRGWVQDGHEPAGGPLDCAFAKARLDKLERAIRRKENLPLPRLSGAARVAALKEARDRALRF